MTDLGLGVGTQNGSHNSFSWVTNWKSKMHNSAVLIKLGEERVMHVLKEMEKRFLFFYAALFSSNAVYPPTTRKPGPKKRIEAAVRQCVQIS